MSTDRLYRWTMSMAERPVAVWGLAGVSFAESSFFPLPPDVLLVPMSLARPNEAWRYAAICTVASVLGGIVGYAIGALLFDTLGRWLIELYGYGAKMEAMRAAYAQWGALLILVKGVTPIPYKLVAIASGLMGYSLPLFVVLSALTRGVRFFVLVALLNSYGDQARALLDRYFGWFMVMIVAFVIVGFVLAAVLA